MVQLGLCVVVNLISSSLDTHTQTSCDNTVPIVELLTLWSGVRPSALEMFGSTPCFSIFSAIEKKKYVHTV